MTDTPSGSASMGHAASGFVAAGNAADQRTSAIVLCDTALANSKLARLCQRGSLLLPVANRPIIQYILDTLVRSGIKKVTFAGTDQLSCDALSMYLTSSAGAPGQQNVSVDVVCDPSCGKSSVSLIRRVLGSNLRSSVVGDHAVAQDGHHQDDDVLVVGNLFVSPSDVSLQGQLLYHKVKKAAVTMMLSQAVEDDNGEYPTREYVAVRSDGIVAAYCPVGASKAGDVKVPAVSLLSRPGCSARLKVHKDVLDMRVYVFNKDALSQVLVENEGLVDLQRHLLPYFVRRTAARGGRMGPIPGVLVPQGMDRMSSSNLSGSGGETDRERTLGRLGVEDDGMKRRTAVLAYVRGGATGRVTKFIGGMAMVSEPGSSSTGDLTAGAMMNSTTSTGPGEIAADLSSSRGSMMIVDSDVSYTNANRDILKNLKNSTVAKGVTMGNKVALGNGSIVGAGSTLADKASVKRSVVGPNCTIGGNAKIINCIIHEGVNLGDGCHVQNSILCRGVTVDTKAVLKDCVVGPNQTVSGAHKGEEFFD